MAESKPSPTGKKPAAKPAKLGTTPTPISGGAGRNLWESDPGAVRKFIEQRPDYEQLCGEVAYILTKRLELMKIKVVAVTSRAKTLASFLEKIERKGYPDPFAEVTDFAGTRVVCYFPDDLRRIEGIIRDEFEVVDRVSKRAEKAIDQFGYMADHYIVKLGTTSAGARYDDLKHMVCEIQVRTVLQDAWAVFSHHLLYKHEDEIPAELKRHINSLAGTLESADLSFQTIREKRDEYLSLVARSTAKNTLSEIMTNLDSLGEYLTKRYPDGKLRVDHLTKVMSVTSLNKNYPTIDSVESLLARTKIARGEAFKDLFGPHILEIEDLSLMLWMSLLLVGDKEAIMAANDHWEVAANKARHLVKPLGG